jgi:hypothetical protein
VRKTNHPNNNAKPLSHRFIIGSIVFIAGFLSPLLIPLVLVSPLPTLLKTALAGGLAFGIPELAAFIAVIIMGREGFLTLKRLIHVSVKKAAPPARVSRRRYRIGLVMFALPLLFAWTGPYLIYMMPERMELYLPLVIMSELVFCSSFLVLGGEFWGKIRALFVWSPQKDNPVSL